MQNICFLDFETTGNNPIADEAIQMGAILVDENLQIKEEFSSFIKPDSKVTISEKAYEIHNISYELLENKPTEIEVLKLFFEKFGTDYSFASWNIGFDITFVRRLCLKHDLIFLYDKINYRHIDVQSVANILRKVGVLPNKAISLSEVADYFNIDRSEIHNAFEDSKVCLNVYEKLISELKSSLK